MNQQQKVLVDSLGWKNFQSHKTAEFGSIEAQTRFLAVGHSRNSYGSISFKHREQCRGWRNTQGGVDQRIMGCQRDTRLFRLGARCSETNMTNPWHTQWFLYIYLTSGSRISGAVPIFRHPCMLPVTHSMVRQPQQKQVRQAQQLRPKLCDSQLLVTRCHESTTEGPSDSLGEKLPITQDIWVHWAQTRYFDPGSQWTKIRTSRFLGSWSSEIHTDIPSRLVSSADQKLPRRLWWDLLHQPSQWKRSRRRTSCMGMQFLHRLQISLG